MTLMCDICKERPVIDTQKIKGEWKGVCRECGGVKENELQMQLRERRN
jgi:hypothetical protein